MELKTIYIYWMRNYYHSTLLYQYHLPKSYWYSFPPLTSANLAFRMGIRIQILGTNGKFSISIKEMFWVDSDFPPLVPEPPADVITDVSEKLAKRCFPHTPHLFNEVLYP